MPAAPGSGSALASPERTRSASNSSGVVRADRGSSQHDVHVLLFARQVQQIDRLAADGDAQRLRNRLGADAVQRGLFLVDDEARLRLVGLDIPVDVHDARRAFENVAHLAGQREAVGFVRAVDFGHERLQHGRPGRHFGDGDARVVLGGDRGDARAHAFGDVVALRFALAFRHEVDLDVRDVRAAAHEVMPHQAVEIERRGDARVDLVIGDLRLGAHGGGDFARGLRGAFERAAFGHVQDDLELALVVERQHLHLHPAEPTVAMRASSSAVIEPRKSQRQRGLRDHRPHEAPIEPREEILLVREVAARLARARCLRSGGNTFCPSAECGSPPRA